MKRNNKIFAILLALLMAFGPAAAVPALAASNSKTPSHVYYFQNGVGTANYTGIVNINGVSRTARWQPTSPARSMLAERSTR